MTNRERVRAVLDFRQVDRLPLIEWAGWWDKTVARWHQEGLPQELTEAFEIRRYLGLDDVQQCWLRTIGVGAPSPRAQGAGVITNEADYEAVLPYLYPDPPPFDRQAVSGWAKAQANGELVVWMTLEGFFWFPRRWLGLEGHLYA
ncbi:MAG: uroporphyrinogen decarboxylase family protein, partial [Candidatus Zipacnadales bacterium]